MVSNEVISGSKIAGEKLIEEGEVTSSSSDDGGQQTLPDDDFPKSKSSSKSSKKKSSKVSGSGFPVCEARKRRKLKKAKDRDKHDLKDPEKRSKKCKHSSKKTLDDPHANNGRKGFKPLRPEDDCSSSTKNVSSKEKLDIFGVDSSDSDDDLDTSHDNNDKDSIDGETSWAGVFSKPMPPKSSKGKYSSKHHHHLKTSSKSRSKDASGSKSRDPTSKSWYDLPDDNLSEFGFDHLDVKSIRAASVVGSPPRKTQEIMSPPHHKSSGRHSNSPPDRYGERGSHSRSRSRHDDYYYDDADGDRRRSHSRTKTRSPSPPVDDYYDSRHSRERDDRRAERQKDWKSKLVSTLRSLSPPDRIRRSRRSSPVIIDRRKDYRDARIFRPHPYIAKPDPSYRKRIEDDDPYYSNKSRDDHSRSHPDDRYHDSRKEYKREEREASVASTVASSVMTSVSKSSNRSRRSGRIYTEEEKIDKKKLLAIARANLAQMVEKGTLPKGVPIERFKLSHLFELKKAQSIQEYTEFCRAISAMEAAAYSDSDLSGSDEDSDDDDVKSVISHVTFGGRHPFELKERKDIQIKVRDFVALQTRTAPEIQEDLRETFPVSSGDRHRKIEWKDVDKVMPPPQMLPPSKLPPKKPKGPPKEQPDDSLTFLKAKEAAATTSTTTTPDAPEVEREIIGPVLPGSAEGTPAATGTPGTPSSTGEGSSLSTSVYPDESEAKRISIGAVMAMRLGAMKILQTDPTNAVALKQMADAQKMVTIIIMIHHVLLVNIMRHHFLSHPLLLL